MNNIECKSLYYKEITQGQFVPREQFEIDQISREYELACARWLESLGYGINPTQVLFDEKWHNLKSSDKNYDSCTYVGHKNNGYPSLVNFRTFNGGGILETYSIFDFLRERDNGIIPIATTPRRASSLTVNEVDEEKRKQANFQKELEAFYRLPFSDGSHPYLIKKGIQHIVERYLTPSKACGGYLLPEQNDIRQGKNNGQYKHKRKGKFIVYALKDENDAIKGLQYIYEDGFKKLAYGSKQTGNYQLLNAEYESTGIIYTVEGLATAGAADLISKKKGMIANCVNAGNVKAVIAKLRSQYPNHKIIHCSDNDWLTALNGNGNAGIKAGMQATHTCDNVKYIVPDFQILTPRNNHGGCLLGKAESDWLDLYQLDPAKAVEQFNNNRNQKGKTTVIIPENIPTKSWKKVVAHLEQVRDIYGLRELRKLGSKIALTFVLDKKRLERLKQLDAKLVANLEQTEKQVEGRVKTKIDSYLDIGGKKINTRYLSSTDVPLNEGGVFFVQSTLGTGKTELIKTTHKEDKRSILITPRISLARNMSQRLGYSNYQDTKKDDDPNHLVCVVNSIPTKTSGKRYDTVIFDEIEQITSGQICGQTVEDKNGTLEALKELAQNAKTVVFMDGFLSKNTLAFAQETLGLDTSRFRVIQNEHQLHKDHRLNFYEKKDQLTASIEKWVKAGEKVFIACNTKNEAQKQARYFEKTYPDLSILQLDSTNASEEKNQDILANINERITDYQLVIFSPTVTSGVSIDTPHFTKVCGIFEGLNNIGTPLDCLQQISRVRNVTEWHAFVGGNHKESLPTTKQEILKSWESAHNYIELPEDSDNPLLTRYAKLYLNVEILRRKMVSDYRNTFLSLARRDGWKIEVVEPVETEAIGKIATQYRREWLYQSILNALDRSEKEIETLKDSENTTQSEYFEIVRFNTQARWSPFLKPEEATGFVEKDHNIPTESGYQTLFSSLPNELNEKILQIDNEGRLWQKLRRLTYTRYDREQAKELALESYEWHLAKGSEIHADNGLLKHDVYANILMTVGVEVDENGKFFQNNTVTINKTSKEVLDCAHYLLERRDAINEAKLGFRVPARDALLENPMKTIAESLNAQGIKLKSGKRETIGSERVRNYTLAIHEIPSLIQFLETEGKDAIKSPSFVLAIANKMPLREMSTPCRSPVETDVSEVWTNSNEVATEYNEDDFYTHEILNQTELAGYFNSTDTDFENYFYFKRLKERLKEGLKKVSRRIGQSLIRCLELYYSKFLEGFERELSDIRKPNAGYLNANKWVSSVVGNW